MAILNKSLIYLQVDPDFDNRFDLLRNDKNYAVKITEISIISTTFGCYALTMDFLDEKYSYKSKRFINLY